MVILTTNYRGVGVSPHFRIPSHTYKYAKYDLTHTNTPLELGLSLHMHYTALSAYAGYHTAQTHIKVKRDSLLSARMQLSIVPQCVLIRYNIYAYTVSTCVPLRQLVDFTTRMLIHCAAGGPWAVAHDEGAKVCFKKLTRGWKNTFLILILAEDASRVSCGLRH